MGWHRIRHAVLLAALVAAGSAMGQGPDLQMLRAHPSLPIADFRLETCNGLPVFGEVTIGLSGDTHLSDGCFDEAQGTFHSALALSGLRQVARSERAARYERAASGDGPYTRDFVSAVPYDAFQSCMDGVFMIEALSNTSPGVPGLNPPDFNGFVNFFGYSTQNMVAQPALNQAQVLLGCRDGSPSGGTAPKPVVGDMIGKLEIAEATDGTLRLTDGLGPDLRAISGDLSLSFAQDGTYQMTGRITGQNARSLDLAPEDVTQFDVQITTFRGHVVGRGGTGLLGFGIVSGTGVNASGARVPILANAYLIGCG